MVQLKFFLAVCFAVALTETECRHLPAEDQPPVARNSTPCSLQPARICSSLQDTDNYSLQLDIHSSSSSYIKVKVHSTRCVLRGGPLPWWYQVELVATEASSGDSEEHDADSRAGGQCLAGRFQVAKRKQEMSLCEADSKAVFSACSPSLMDLPRELSFYPHSQCAENDTLCFRLTLQESEERACLQKQVCLQLPTWPPPKQTPSSNSNAVGGDSRSVGHSNTLLEVVYPPSMVHVGSGFVEGSGDGSEYVDLERDEEMIQKILNDMIEMGGKVEEIPYSKGCHQAKAIYTRFNLSWIPDCDCEGYYKDMQCTEINNEMQCWCATPSGSEVFNSRKTIHCSDPQSLEFQC